MTATDPSPRRSGPVLLLAILLFAGALTGCLGDETAPPPASEDDNQDEPAQDGPTSVPWGLTNCRIVIAAIPVDSAGLQERMPENFTAQTPEAFGLPPHPTADAVLGLETFACEEGLGLNGTVDEMAYGSVFVPVNPPEEHDTDHPLEFVKWETLVPDPPRREFLAAAGLPVVDGGTDLSNFNTLPSGGFAFSASVDLGGEVHTFTGSAATPAEGLQGTLSFIEWVPTGSGLATFVVQASAPSMMQGSGVVQLASGSFPAQVVGDERAQAFLLASDQVVFADGVITLPG